MSKTTTTHASVDDGLETRKRAFKRKARQATHQILFYLGLYYRPITLLKRKKHDRTDDVLKHDSNSVLLRLQALVAGVGYRDDQDVEANSWRSLRKKVETCVNLWPYQENGGVSLSEEETYKKLQELRNDCAKFLSDSKPDDLNTYITHLINKGRIGISRWLARILISVAALFLVFMLPQVTGLVQQTGWGTLLPFILFTIAARTGNWLGRWRIKAYGEQYWWDFGGQSFHNGDARPPERGFGRFAEGDRVPFALMVRILFNICMHVVALAIVLLLTSIVASWQEELLVTVALILAALFVLYVLADVLDFWDYYDSVPVRLFFLALLLVAIVGINSFKLLLAPTFLWVLTLGSLLLLVSRVSRGTLAQKKQKKSFLEALLDTLRHNGQGAAVTAGLLLMAWLVTGIATTQFGEPWEDNESTIERINAAQWPKSVRKLKDTKNDPVVVLAASGGGSRAAIYVAHTLLMLHEPKLHHIGCNLQAISSVSGGSLANAVYTTQRLGVPCGPELHSQLRDEEDGLLRKVSGDFLKPTIVGALRGTAFGPFGSSGGRSESIEEAWRKLGLTVNLDELAQEWGKGLKAASKDYPPFPIPLFNSTSLETHRVVLSPFERTIYTDPVVSESAREAKLFNSLSKRYTEQELAKAGLSSEELAEAGLSPKELAEAVKEPTWVYYRDGIYGLEDLLPNFTPDLAQCVRASANFPVGFPLVEVRTKESLFYSPNEDRREKKQKQTKDNVYLSDGGVLSNSGIWSLYHLLRNQHTNLEGRGVLVIIVDASAMQDYREPTRIEGLFSAIRSQQPIGQSLHRRMFESLKYQYGERIQIVQIDLIPTEKTNIETTWTLSAESKKSLETQFKIHRPVFKKDLETAWSVLVGNEDVQSKRYLERPPVD